MQFADGTTWTAKLKTMVPAAYSSTALDGNDTINDYGSNDIISSTGMDDTLKFGAGIAASQLWFKKVGNDLDVTRIGSTEAIVIKDLYSSGFQHIEQFKSADGKTLLDGQVDTLVSVMADFAPPLAGQTRCLPTIRRH